MIRNLPYNLLMVAGSGGAPSGQAARSFWFKFGAPRAGIMSQMITPGGCRTA